MKDACSSCELKETAPSPFSEVKSESQQSGFFAWFEARSERRSVCSVRARTCADRIQDGEPDPNFQLINSMASLRKSHAYEKVAVYKEYNIRRHYSTRHAEEYTKYHGDERKNRVTNLKKCLLRQQDLFKKAKKENEAAVEASYVVSEMIAKAGKPFKEGKFIKNCMLLAASKVCPEKKGQFSDISLSANTVAERISDLSENIYHQLREKAERFCAYSVALDESTDNTDTAQLGIYVCGVDDNFEVIEELLTVIPMHGQTTAQEMFLQLCGAIEDAGLPWKRFTGMTDGAPSMTGRKNGLVALVQRKLEEENVEEAIALHCIIHQQALCGKCLGFDNVMSVVVKCINHIRARGLKHQQFRTVLEEIESEYEDVLYFMEVRWLSRGNVLKRFFEL
ncbi:SCAN domain-containing protein [Pimephales promelas]|nr:SCAN domain-containing protein [Pimephales promelas]